MGLFGNLFSKTKATKKEKNSVPWIALERMEQLDEIIQKSNEKPQLLFKHSTTCGISRMVLNIFSDNYSAENVVDAYFLDLHAHRAISDEAAQRLGVMHQSPQLIVIKNEQVTYHASHGAITETTLQELL
ncbi:bacillithiol system redox-active protein YtxJ [Allomuricauda sp. d1]|uniref:bacillithiol system redox-active protein YtxJ n=1 Tax=Allomuricauda sp. d1 TaxID=3136725 RepID=UPI0031E10FBD